MLLPRLESTGDPCPSGSGSCSTSALSTSSEPGSPDTYDDSDNPNYHNTGPQRYIGIVMVAVIALAIFAYWIVWMFKKKNRASIEGDDLVLFPAPKSELPLSQSKSRSWLCFGRRRAPPTTPPSPASSAPSSADPEKIKFNFKELQLPAQSALQSPESPERSRKISEVEKTRRRVLEDSAPRGKVVKEVSGGMVIYTTRRSREAGARQSHTAPLSPTLSVPESALRPPRRSSRRIEPEERRGRRRSPVRGRVRSVDLNADWHMEHVQGVRYEARTPPER
ncbi:hypothetical protein CPB83DRAFT_904104 [Crepidotus variabilis]|uniref:Uncharacterized protein n=1 Tax=Crepidotus variabilis TaxID=179855 RepID=A0A9P6JT52_9AGAR|nr:hypothetical protein CPB83DRAFT_904104 [Crepidotus variabilis]